jgi:hypothetical protein
MNNAKSTSIEVVGTLEASFPTKNYYLQRYPSPAKHQAILVQQSHLLPVKKKLHNHPAQDP